MKANKLQFHHYSALVGFLLLIVWVLAMNRVLPEFLANIYLLLSSGALIGLGYLLAKNGDDEEYRPTNDIAPGAGNKKHIISDKSFDGDFGGGGGD